MLICQPLDYTVSENAGIEPIETRKYLGIKEEIVPSFYNFHPISAFFNSACARLGLLLAALSILFIRVCEVHVGKSAEAELLI
jgi:hypothetical protein